MRTLEHVTAMDVLTPLIETFGVLFVVGTWLFIPTIIGTAFLVGDHHVALKIVGFLAPFLVWPVSLWMLKTVYDFVPMLRVILGVDVTDLSVFGYLVIFTYGFLHEVTDELTGVIER